MRFSFQSVCQAQLIYSTFRILIWKLTPFEKCLIQMNQTFSQKYSAFSMRLLVGFDVSPSDTLLMLTLVKKWQQRNCCHCNSFVCIQKESRDTSKTRGEKMPWRQLTKLLIGSTYVWFSFLYCSIFVRSCHGEKSRIFVMLNFTCEQLKLLC